MLEEYLAKLELSDVGSQSPPIANPSSPEIGEDSAESAGLAEAVCEIATQEVQEPSKNRLSSRLILEQF